MRRRTSELDTLSVRVAVVTFEAREQARTYAESTDLPWTLLIDETRALYRAYGMDRGSLLDIWGPRTWLAYARELVRGQRIDRRRVDWAQLGGDVLIDPDGTVRLHHIGVGPADRPPVSRLLDVVWSQQDAQ